MGGAEVWRIAGSGYLVWTPKKGSAEWFSEWFYIDDAALSDPVRRRLPEFFSARLKKLYNWRPKSSAQEDSAEVMNLVNKIKILTHSGLSLVEVLAIHDKEMHPATSIPSNSPMELQGGGRCILL